MSNLKYRSSHELTAESINANVTANPGVYLLGYTDKNGFQIKYVGRSDDNINKRLHDWIDKYGEFKFLYCTNKKTAYDNECKCYHSCIEDGCDLDTTNHPDKPDAMNNISCPVCGR